MNQLFSFSIISTLCFCTLNSVFTKPDILIPDSWTLQEQYVWESLIKGDTADLNKYVNVKNHIQKQKNKLDQFVISREFIETLLFEDPYKTEISRYGLRLKGARFIEEINLDNTTITHPIYFLFCNFDKPVSIARAKAEKFISFRGSKFNKNAKLDFRRIQTSRSLDLSRTKINQLLLLGAKIDGMLDLRGAQIPLLNMRRIRVNLSLLLRESNEKEPGKYKTIILHDAEIGGDLVISNSRYDSLFDLTSAQINGEFRLGSNLHSPAIWGDSAKLILRNTSVTSFQDGGESIQNWPTIDLIGFKYMNLGGLSQSPKESILNRSEEWFQSWLGKQAFYSPQPYQYLANILHNAGFEDKSDRVGYLGKNQELKSAWDDCKYRRWFSLFLQRIFIGFGYYLMRTSYWIMLFTIIGAFINKSDKNGLKKPWYDRIFYSFDMLIPAVSLDSRNTLHHIKGKALYYFYFHKIIGFILASYLVAGLSGITK